MSGQTLDYEKLFPGRDGYPDYEDLPAQEDRIAERDWDILVCLDACRWDAMRIVMEYEDKDPDIVDKYRTPSDCSTPGWLYNLWHSDFADWSDITYVMANGVWEFMQLTEAEREVHDFDVTVGETYWMGYDLSEHVKKVVNMTDDDVMLREANKTTGYGGSVRPDGVTEAASNQEPPMVVHYMQPHTPFIGDINLNVAGDHPIVRDVSGTGGTNKLPRGGHVTQSLYRAAYMGNLRVAWMWAKKLMDKFPNQKIIFTSDHGETLGPDKFDHGGPDDPRNQVVPWVDSDDL